MADLIATGTSDYVTGGLDSATVLVSNVSPISAKHPNGLASGIVQVETVLGSGTSLRGTQADLVARLAVALNADGTIKTGSTSAFTGQLTVPNGGTGQGTAPDQKMLIGNGTGFDLLTPRGYIYTGPTTQDLISTASTVQYEGPITLATNQALDGIHFYSDFTLNAGVTLTLGNSSHRLIICAFRTITINGIIDAIGAGASATQAGFSQAAGGGGDGAAGTATAGGSALHHGLTMKSGGAAGSSSAGGTPASLSGTAVAIDHPYSILGGAGGGNGAGGSPGAGGRGGGSIILIAPVITLGGSSQLKTSGSPGVAGGNQSGGGGGGGAGNVYFFCRVMTDSGCTVTKSGGAGGAAGASGGFAGGSGAPGVFQAFIYSAI